MIRVKDLHGNMVLHNAYYRGDVDQSDCHTNDNSAQTTDKHFLYIFVGGYSTSEEEGDQKGSNNKDEGKGICDKDKECSNSKSQGEAVEEYACTLKDSATFLNTLPMFGEPCYI